MRNLYRGPHIQYLCQLTNHLIFSFRERGHWKLVLSIKKQEFSMAAIIFVGSKCDQRGIVLEDLKNNIIPAKFGCKWPVVVEEMIKMWKVKTDDGCQLMVKPHMTILGQAIMISKHGRDRMVAGFSTIYAINAYHH